MIIFVLTFLVFFGWSPPSMAQVTIPPAGEAGIAEKSLRQSQQKPFNPLLQEKTEIITIEDSRELVDPGAGPSFFVKKVKIEGNTLFDNETLDPIVDLGDEGLELTLGILSLMAQEVSAHYSQEGYFLAKAYIPEQELIDDTVLMKIDEGKIGKISVEKNKRTNAKDLLKRMQPIADQDILKEETLERTLLEINSLAGIKARSILRPGELPGTSDLVLEITETSPYSFSFDVDNFGSEFTGENRAGITATAGSTLVLGDFFLFRGVASELDQQSYTLSYQYPLNDLGRKTLKFSYTYSEQTLGASLVALKGGGRTRLFNIEYGQTLFRDKSSGLNFRFGFDHKKFVNFALGSTTSNDVIRDVYAGISGNFSDSYLGNNIFDWKVQYGIFANDSAALPSRVNGNADIFLTSLNLTRYQGTPLLDSYFIWKANTQLVSSRTLSPDQYAVGGFGTVRGYPLAAQSGDWGYNLATEYVLPFPSKYPFGIDKFTIGQLISFTGFLEYGKVFTRGLRAGETKMESIAGGGFGVQINVPKGGDFGTKEYRPPISFSISYGLPLTGARPSDGSSGIVYASGSIGLF
jgi:hemolysin activation/secretion protein